MVEPLQVDHQNLREPIDGQIFLNVYFPLALATFESSLHHALGFDILLEALRQLDAAEEPNRFAWYLDTQVHKVVKCAIGETAAEALRPIE